MCSKSTKWLCKLDMWNLWQSTSFQSWLPKWSKISWKQSTKHADSSSVWDNNLRHLQQSLQINIWSEKTHEHPQWCPPATCPNQSSEDYFCLPPVLQTLQVSCWFTKSSKNSWTWEESNRRKLRRQSSGKMLQSSCMYMHVCISTFTS